MKTLIATSSAFIGFLITVLHADAGIIAGPITNPDNGQEYYLLTPNTWTASEAEAESLGGTLAVINNSAEHDWIFSTFGSYGGNAKRSLWIGLRRDRIGGPFQWTAGTPVTYTNWSPGEPDNCGGNESYVHMWSNSTQNPGKWNDAADDLNLEGSQPNGVVEVPREKALSENERALVGTWYEAGRFDRPRYFAGTTNLLFGIGGYGRSSRIIYASASHLLAADWHTRAEIVQDRILWSDGTWWSRKPSNYTDGETHFSSGVQIFSRD